MGTTPFSTTIWAATWAASSSSLSRPFAGPAAVEALTYLGLAALGVLVVFGCTLRWVWNDALRRGSDPRLAVLFVGLVFWPLSLAVWWLGRENIHLAPEGGGSAWG